MLIETQLEGPEALVRMRAARKSKGLTLAQVAEKIGKSPVWVGAVFSGQAMLTPDTAVALAHVLDLAAGDLAALTEAPVRNSDPFLYRLHEMCDVYGDALRMLTNEQFGDGILSAIDLKIAFERRGERAIVTLDAKFLPYKEF
ncbi:MAG: cyanase [Candidatus Velthaea sp.]